MKEIPQRITELMNESHQAIEDIVEQAVANALSANNAKWREKIEERNGFCELGGGINICISEEQWQSILSQMEGE